MFLAMEKKKINSQGNNNCLFLFDFDVPCFKKKKCSESSLVLVLNPKIQVKGKKKKNDAGIVFF